MKTRILSTFLALFLFSTPGLADETPIRGELTLSNLGVAKLQVRQYIESGGYQHEFDQVVQSAQSYLEQNLERYRESNPALVLDIDETSISNLPYLLDNDFGYVPAPWQAWVKGDEAAPFSATLKLYRWARDNGVSVFFVTSRPETDREATERLLRRTGYSDIAGLYLKPLGEKATSAAYKAAQRRKITDAGYRIVVNLGDQWTDLDGGYAEAMFKLPNPMYFVP